MNFSQVTNQFETTAPGTDAFLTVKEEMRSLVASAKPTGEPDAFSRRVRPAPSVGSEQASDQA